MSYQQYTLSSLLRVFCSSCWWSQWRLWPEAVPDFRMLPSLPHPLCYLHLPFYPLYLAACQTTLCHRPSIQMLTIFVFLFISFHWSVHICLPFYCLVYKSCLFFSLSIAPSTAPTKKNWSISWVIKKNRSC